jgi:hypothetical protein
MNGESPECVKLAEASPTLYPANAVAVTEPPIALAMSASQRVGYPFDVPISNTRRATVARTSPDRNLPVSGGHVEHATRALVRRGIVCLAEALKLGLQSFK